MDTDPLRAAVRSTYQKEITKAARDLERARARRRALVKQLDAIDETIRHATRTLRALIDDATAGPTAPAFATCTRCGRRITNDAPCAEAMGALCSPADEP